jgi:hypothetical protein
MAIAIRRFCFVVDTVSSPGDRYSFETDPTRIQRISSLTRWSLVCGLHPLWSTHSRMTFEHSTTIAKEENRNEGEKFIDPDVERRPFGCIHQRLRP